MGDTHPSLDGVVVVVDGKAWMVDHRNIHTHQARLVQPRRCCDSFRECFDDMIMEILLGSFYVDSFDWGLVDVGLLVG